MTVCNWVNQSAPAFGFGSGCDKPADISHGSTVWMDASTAGVVTYNCDAGYDLVGEHQRVCRVPGDWSGYPPTCQSKCSYPSMTSLPVISNCYTHTHVLFDTMMRYCCTCSSLWSYDGVRKPLYIADCFITVTQYIRMQQLGLML